MKPRRRVPVLAALLVMATTAALALLLHDLFAGRLIDPPPPTTAVVALPLVAVGSTPSVESTATHTAMPSPTPAPTLTPSLVPTQPATPTSFPPTVSDYIGHVVARGETLDILAAAGGSTADLIASYNHLQGEPQPGRMLLIPHLADRPTTLTNQPLLVRRGRADLPLVALTFDAGGDADAVPDLLRVLRERQAHVTFFLTAKWAREYPDLARQIAADGHEIANHTTTHADLTRLPNGAIVNELAGAENAVQEATGKSTRPLFRPPYGAVNEHVLLTAQAAGYLPILWTLDSQDSIGEPKTAGFLVQQVATGLPENELPGAIILMHCGYPTTAEAVPQILDYLAAHDLGVAPVSDVLGR